MKNGIIDISIYCSYIEIEDFLKVLILQGYTEGIFSQNEFKNDLEKFISNIKNLKFTEEEKKNLSEKRYFKLLTLNS